MEWSRLEDTILLKCQLLPNIFKTIPIKIQLSISLNLSNLF